jgi:hypothetical protein
MPMTLLTHPRSTDCSVLRTQITPVRHEDKSAQFAVFCGLLLINTRQQQQQQQQQTNINNLFI